MTAKEVEMAPKQKVEKEDMARVDEDDYELYFGKNSGRSDLKGTCPASYNCPD